MITIFCPQCNTEETLSSASPGMAPPTGGDYDWVESDHDYSCSHCQKVFRVRLRTSLDGGEILLCLSSPKPLDSL